MVSCTVGGSVTSRPVVSREIWFIGCSCRQISLVTRPYPKHHERGLVSLAKILVCAESAYYVAIRCLA